MSKKTIFCLGVLVGAIVGIAFGLWTIEHPQVPKQASAPVPTFTSPEEIPAGYVPTCKPGVSRQRMSEGVPPDPIGGKVIVDRIIGEDGGCYWEVRWYFPKDGALLYESKTVIDFHHAHGNLRFLDESKNIFLIVQIQPDNSVKFFTEPVR